MRGSLLASRRRESLLETLTQTLVVTASGLRQASPFPSVLVNRKPPVFGHEKNQMKTEETEMRNNINREIIGAMRDFLLSDGSAKSRRLLRSAIRRECVLTTVDQVFGKITDETRRIAADHFESYRPKHPLVAKGVEYFRELSVYMCDLAV